MFMLTESFLKFLSFIHISYEHIHLKFVFSIPERSNQFFSVVIVIETTSFMNDASGIVIF